MRKISIYFLFLVIAILSCKENMIEKKENLFKNYLIENFSESIPQNKQLFILIPNVGCSGCIQSYISDFKTTLDTTKTELTIITSNENIYSALKNHPVKILFDKDEKLDNINLGLSSVTSFYTNNEKLEKIVYVY